METQEFVHQFLLREGFVPDGPELEGIPDSVIEGSNSWLYNGRWVSDRGVTALGSAGAALRDLQVIRGFHAGCTGVGNIWSAWSTDWTTGNAYINGANIGNAGGVLSLVVNLMGVDTLVPAGLAQPAAPTFVASATSGRLNGAYSVVVQALRKRSGAKSSRSDPSATLVVQNKKGTLTFPAPVSGQSHWIVGGSIRAVPEGPWYRLTQQAIVPTSTASIEIDWVNGELGSLMPINFDQPPACTHVAALGGVVLAIGCDTGGFGVRPSLPTLPEAYPPEFGFDLPVREAVTGVQPGLEGVVLVSTTNGLMALLLSGANDTPILSRVIFGNVGFAKANAFCSVYDQIYGHSSKAGAVRTHGGEEPDSTFAQAVQRYFARNNFDSTNTVVVFDQLHDAVIWASGTKAVPYMRASGRWSAPITLPGTVTAGIALNGVANLQIGSTLYSLDTANAGSTWFLRSPFSGMEPSMLLNVKQAREFYGAGNSSITHDLLVPDSTWESGTTIGGLFPYLQAAPFGALGARCKKPARNFRVLAYKASGTTGGQTPEMALLKGKVYPIAA